MGPLLLGVNVSTSAAPGADPITKARRAEDLRFDFISSSDHPCGKEPSYETWTMLSWIAASTSRIKVASRVLGVPYRPPAMVAKMAETLHRLSDGRLILGLGGGYSDEEFRAFGLRVPSPREKVEGLEEAIHIMHGLWTEPTFTHHGRHYLTEAAPLAPKPQNHIPIWLGTFGPRALALTGRVADGWIPSLSEDAPPQRIPAMRDRVFRAAQEAGRDPEKEITCAYNVEVRVGEPSGDDPYLVAGPPEAVVDRIRTFVDLGFTAINLKPVGPGGDEQVERLGHEVVPSLRAG